MTDAEQSNEPARAQGRAPRDEVPRSRHGQWTPAPDRPDPVELIAGQNESRVQFLVPIRHQRMRSRRSPSTAAALG